MLILGFLSVAACIVVWIGVYRLCVRHPLDVFALMMYLFAFMQIFRPLLFVLGLDTPHPDRLFMTVNYEPLLIEGQVLTIVWLLFMAWGARLATGSPVGLGRVMPSVRGLPNSKVFLYIVAGITALALLVTLYLLKRFGGYAAMIYAVKVDKDLAGMYVLRQFGALGCFLSAALALYLAYLRRHGVARVATFWIVMALAMAAVNMLCVFAWGNRGAAVMSFLSLMFGFHLFIQRVPIWGIGLATCLFVSAILGLRVVRDQMLTGEISDSISDESAIRAFSVGTNNTRFDAFMLMLKDFRDTDELRWGEDFVNGFAGMIPRSVWPNKPEVIAPGNWFRKNYDPDVKNGWPFTIVGEWYINFWYFGVCVGGLISGFLYRVLQYVYVDFLKNPISFIFSLIVVKMVFESGFWSQGPTRYVLWCIPMLGVSWLLQRTIPPRRQAARHSAAPATADAPQPAGVA
ncbi:MAG: oligosaccharide repeat unit polymerase [Planctomycetales bacterium]|nr:oligosaccharide repeat unit polymerase [Planctomycetales bacterium]